MAEFSGGRSPGRGAVSGLAKIRPESQDWTWQNLETCIGLASTDFSPIFSFPSHAAEGEAKTVSCDLSLRKSSQKQSSKSKVIGGNSYQFGECITPNLGCKR
jgi:hypothetical protein